MNGERCKHGMVPDWCAVCNPPAGHKPSKTVVSGRGVGRIFGDTRPMYNRPITLAPAKGVDHERD
jgi:hypothetical protein